MAEYYNGPPLTDEQCEDLLQHLISTLAASGLSHLTISIEENLAFIALNATERERPSVDEADEYPTTIFRRLLHYLDTTIEYLQQNSSHHVESILKQINQHLTDGKVTDIVVERNNIIDDSPRQISISSLPNYLELITALQQIREQITMYRGNDQ